MNMRSRAVATVIFLALAVGLVLLLVYGDLGGSDEADEVIDEGSEALSPLFPEAQPYAVRRVRIVSLETGDTFSAVRLPSEQPVTTPQAEGEPVDLFPTPVPSRWEITDSVLAGPTEIIDVARLDEAVLGLPTLTPRRVFSEVEALTTFGLGDDARYEVVFEVENGDLYTLTIGAENTAGTFYYAQLPGDTQVFLIPRFSIDRLIEFLTDPPYLDAPFEDLEGTPAAGEGG